MIKYKRRDNMSVLPSEMISQFVKETNDSKKFTNTAKSFYGTAVVNSSGIYVRLDGSEALTPVSMATDAKNNDRVLVTIEDHKASITNNITSPASGRSATDLYYVETNENGDIIVKGELRAAKEYVDELIAKNITVSSIEAQSAKIITLEAQQANFENATAENFTAVRAEIENLVIGNLDAKYANIDLANVDTAKIRQGFMETLMVSQGIFTSDITAAEGTFTNYLTGVNILANNITAGTLSVERLIITGSDQSVVYEINKANGTPQLSQTTVDGGSLTERTITADRIVAESITGNEIAATTITGQHIVANSITAVSLDVESIFAQDITATGTITGINLIGATGSFSGNITAATGTIGPWNIGNTSIWKGNSSFSNVSGMYFGNDGLSITDKFKVSSAGIMTATNGTFSGTINATSGTFKNGRFDNCTFNDLNDQGYGITISRSGDTSVFKAYGSENLTQITGDGGVMVTSKGNYVYAALTDSGVMENGTLISNKYAAKSHSHSYLPLSGGQMTGNINMGHRHYLTGKTNAGGSHDVSGIGIGGTDSVNCVYLGNTSLRTYLRGASVRLKDGTAVTSNLEKKHDVYPLENSKYEDMFNHLNPVSYKLNDGDSGRDHLGFGAQHVVEAIRKAGLTTQEYGAVIIDYVDGQPVDYCLRYEEFIALNTHMIQKTRKDLDYQVGRIDMQQAIINDLQTRLWRVEKEIKELKRAAQ